MDLAVDSRIAMAELSVVIVATDNEQRALLQVLVDGTSVARTVQTCSSFPMATGDPVVRRVRAANPEHPTRQAGLIRRCGFKWGKADADTFQSAGPAKR